MAKEYISDTEWHEIKMILFQRNHTLMFEMMALMFAVTCFYLYVFLIQLWLWPIQCIATVFVIVYNYYLYIVVYSLYRIFRKEHEQAAVRQQKGKIETDV